MIVQFAGHGERIGSLTEPRNRNRRQYGENRHDPPFTPRPSQHLYVSHEISVSAAAATSAGPLPVPHQWARDAVILCISEQNTTLPDCDYFADLRADHLAGDHDFHAPIRLSARRCVIGSHRLSLAEALRRDRVHRHSLLAPMPYTTPPKAPCLPTPTPKRPR